VPECEPRRWNERWQWKVSLAAFKWQSTTHAACCLEGGAQCLLLALRDILRTRSDYVAFGVKRTFVPQITKSRLLLAGQWCASSSAHDYSSFLLMLPMHSATFAIS
jgi:hypothetical protein